MLSSLDALKGLKLVELFLDGNPCKKRIKDNAHYVRYPPYTSVHLSGIT